MSITFTKQPFILAGGVVLALSLNNIALSKDYSEAVKVKSGLGTLKVLGQRCRLFFVEYNSEENHAVSGRHCLSKALTKKALLYGGDEIKPYQEIIGKWEYAGEVFESKLTIERIGTELIGDDWVLLKLLNSPPKNKFFKFTYPTAPLNNDYSGVAFSTSTHTQSVNIKNCQFNALLKASGSDVIRVDNCPLSKGDSGGPFFQISPSGSISLLGVVKAKHSTKNGISYYVPLWSKY